VRETIVFCAHHDTKIDTPARAITPAASRPSWRWQSIWQEQSRKRGWEFVSFTNEEYLPIGVTILT
jgi:hypothetical protein